MEGNIKEYFEDKIQGILVEIQMVESCESDILITCQKMLFYLQDVLAVKIQIRSAKRKKHKRIEFDDKEKVLKIVNNLSQ